MLSSGISIVWLVGLCIAYSSSAPSTTTRYRYFSSPNKNVTLREPGLNETHIVYHSCSSAKNYEKHCELTLESLHGRNQPLSCNVITKHSTTENARIESVETAIILDNDRALVISYYSDGELVLTNLNFHGCGVKQTRVHMEKIAKSYNMGNIAAYEDGYMLLFVNFTLCQRRFCSMTFDNEGNVLQGATPWGDEFGSIAYIGNPVGQTVAHRSPVNGFIFSSHSTDVHHPFFYSRDGKQILSTDKGYSGDLAVSTIGNAIGTCSVNLWIRGIGKSFDVLECKRYDFEGKLLKTELQVNTSSLVGEYSQIRYMNRINLPEGFILFAALCPKSMNHQDCEASLSHTGYRFNGNGEVIKKIEIPDLMCGPIAMPSWSFRKAFKHADGRACLVSACEHFKTKFVFSLSTHCSTADEL